MATQVERETSERDERVDSEREEKDSEREEKDSLPPDGGFARLDPPGTEPSEQ
jgi:hypothetical protein